MSELNSLEPDFWEKIKTLLDQVHKITGLQWIVTSGRRTMAEQQYLFDQGRTSPGKIVTINPPESSAHVVGLAADLAPLQPSTGEIWWDAPADIWRAMADTAQDLGMVAGFFQESFCDASHVEDATYGKKALEALK